MLIIALVLAVIGLAALVTAVVTSNELIAWVCIGASVIGVLLLIVDALRERSRGAGSPDSDGDGDGDGDEQTVALTEPVPAEDYPDEPTTQFAGTSEASESVEHSADADTTAVAVDDEQPDDEQPVDEQPIDSEQPDEADTTKG